MQMMCLIITIISHISLIQSISIIKKPLETVYTADSILSQPGQGLFIGDHSRRATCSGVSWFHQDKYIATVNLLGDKLSTYEFNPETESVVPLQTFSEGLAYPVAVHFNSDGTLAAITNSKNGSIKIYQVNQDTHLINPNPIFCYQHTQDYPNDKVVHGVRFSPNSNYLAFTSIGRPGYIRIFTIERQDTNIKISSNHTLTNPFFPLKPKAIDFTKDEKFVAIIYAKNAAGAPNIAGKSLLAIHAFDSTEGIINENPISIADETSGLLTPEDVIFSSDDLYLIATNQETNSVSLFTFDKNTGQIGSSAIVLDNPDSELNFPHGCSLSKNNNYLAVTNLGDDKFTIYKVIK